MNKTFFAILIGFLFSFTMNAQKTVILTDGTIVDGLSDATPTRNVEESENSITVTYNFHRLNILPDPLFPSAVTPSINGFGYEHTPGKPEVPMRWDAISLPLNTQGQVSVIDSSYIDIPMELSPARHIRSCGDDEYSTSNVPAVSLYRGFFPAATIPSFDQFSYRGTPVMNICVCPIKYNSQTKTTRVFSQIKYRVTWTNKRTSFTAPSQEKRHSSAEFLNKLTLNSLNTQGVRDQNTLTTEDYLIISTETFRPAVERLADWKRMLGFRVKVCYQSNWTANNIKAYIQGQNDSLPNLSYVLLIGGHNKVRSFVYPDSPNYLSDHLYSCMDEDYYPEIYRGRLLVSTIEEAEILVDKIINYERNPVKSCSFYNTGINGALFEAGVTGYEGSRAVLTSELIRTVLVDSLQKDINFVYLKNGDVNPAHWAQPPLSSGNELPESIIQNITWNGTAKKLMNYIDDGAFYTIFFGHGLQDQWESLNHFNKDSLNRLNNGIKYPVIFSMSCYTGDFRNNGISCFAQHFCSLDGNGCVAMFAPTKGTQQGVSDIFGMNLFDAIWPNSHFNPIYPRDSVNRANTPVSTPTNRLGEMLNYAIYKTRQTWNEYDSITSRIFHCYGDPSMRIYTEQPTAFEDAYVGRSGGNIVVNAYENDAEISFYNRTTGEVLRYNGSQYTYNCGTDDVSVCISGYNKIPYVDQLYLQNEVVNGPIEINGGSIKAGYSVTDNKAYGNVTFHSGDITIKGNSIELDAGTTVEMGATLSIETR